MSLPYMVHCSWKPIFHFWPLEVLDLFGFSDVWTKGFMSMIFFKGMFNRLNWFTSEMSWDELHPKADDWTHSNHARFRCWGSPKSAALNMSPTTVYPNRLSLFSIISYLGQVSKYRKLQSISSCFSIQKLSKIQQSVENSSNQVRLRYADWPPSTLRLWNKAATFSRRTILGRRFLTYFSIPR